MALEPSRLAVDVPAELVAEIAVGAEEPDDIRKRLGISDEAWESLKDWPPFVRAVEAQRAEYEKTGVTFRTKAKLKAEMLSDRVFVRAMAADAPVSAQLAALEHFVKIADLAPKQNAPAQVGTGFSITINIPTSGPPPAAKDMGAVEVVETQQLPVYLREQPKEELPS